jgi:hypothetical protein
VSKNRYIIPHHQNSQFKVSKVFMAKVLESLIAKGRRARRPPEQKEIAFGLADLSTHGMYQLLII